jgi:Replicative DNA helicase
MSKWVQTHLPCPECPSTDAYSIDKDGVGFCFSCNKPFGKKGNELSEDTTYTYEYLPRRGITKETHEFFGVLTQINDKGVPVSVAYPYANGSTKVRTLNPKGFFSRGAMSEASGWAAEKFPAGSAKAITITEGEDDAMSVWQMLGRYPVYSVRSATSAVADVRRDFDKLNSFEKIYLALDNDNPGKKATQELAAIFGFQKVYHVKLAPYKDAHDFLEAGKITEFRNSWYNAGRFLPEGIKSSFSDIDGILDRASKEPGVSWPFPTLTALTGGLKRGRAYLISGLEGIGKTELFHATEFHLAKNDPDANIGILHFEEPTEDTIKKQAGYELRVPAHADDSNISIEEIKAAFRKVAGREDRIHFLEHYGSEEPDVILSKIRFLVAACQCKYIFLDNITVLTTGRMQDSATKELDWLSTRLVMLAKELRFVLVVISHENDNEQTRGSHNISKVFDVWVNLKRNLKSDNEYLRRVIYATIFKNRQSWKTGPAGRFIYDPATSVLSEINGDLPT